MNTVIIAIIQKLTGQRDKSRLIIFNNGLKEGNKMEQIKNTMYIMKDTMRTTQYTDLAQFWVYGSQE